MSNVTIVLVQNNSSIEFLSEKANSLVLDTRIFGRWDYDPSRCHSALKEMWGARLAHTPELGVRTTDTAQSYTERIAPTLNKIEEATKKGKPIVLLGASWEQLLFLASALSCKGVRCYSYYDYTSNGKRYKGVKRRPPLEAEEIQQLLLRICIAEDDESLSSNASDWGF